MSKELVVVSKTVQSLLEEVEPTYNDISNFKIISAEAYVEAGELLKVVKAKITNIEDARKKMTKPLDESKKNIMDFFRTPLEHLAKAEDILKKKILLWRKKNEEKQAKIEEKIEQAVLTGAVERVDRLTERAPIKDIGGISVKIIWKFEIVDESKLPREYLIPDLKKLGEVARGLKDKAEVKGVRFYSEENVSGSTKG